MEHRIVDNNTIEKTDITLSRILVLVIFLTFVTNISAPISGITGISSGLVSTICKVVIAAGVLSGIFSLIRRTSVNFCLLVIGITVLFTFNYLLFGSGNDLFFTTVTRFYTMVLPVVWVATSINDFSYLFDLLKKTSAVIVLLSLLLLLMVGTSSGNYWMGLGYAMLLPELVLLYTFFKTQKISSLVLFIAGIFPILVYGSRGPIACIALYFIIKYIGSMTSEGKLSIKRFVVVFFVSASLIVLIVCWDDFIRNSITILSNFGIRSRTLDLLSKGILEYSGRDTITSIVLGAANQNPFAIRGINADYLLIGQYSHNIFLELYYEFGIIITSIVSAIIIYFVFITIKQSKKSIKGEFVLIVMCSSLPALLFSGTLWQDTYFWVWIMLVCISIKKLTVRKRM